MQDKTETFLHTFFTPPNCIIDWNLKREHVFTNWTLSAKQDNKIKCPCVHSFIILVNHCSANVYPRSRALATGMKQRWFNRVIHGDGCRRKHPTQTVTHGRRFDRLGRELCKYTEQRKISQAGEERRCVRTECEGQRPVRQWSLKH